MTLDEAIKHAEEVADKKEREKQKWERWLKNDSDYRAAVEKVSCELCAEEHRQLAEWLKELKQLREQTRWIPVSERLPEDEQEILFSTRTGRVHSGKYHDDGSANPWYSHRDKCRAWNNVVIAWMPLPQPYKEESEVEE